MAIHHVRYWPSVCCYAMSGTDLERMRRAGEQFASGAGGSEGEGERGEGEGEGRREEAGGGGGGGG
eukprot:2954723-Rhodomonas_salina.2